MPDQEAHCHDGPDYKGGDHYGVHRAKNEFFFAIYRPQRSPDKFSFATISLRDGFLHGLFVAYAEPNLGGSNAFVRITSSRLQE